MGITNGCGKRVMRVLVALLLLTTTLVAVPAGPIGAAPGDAPVTGSIFVDFDRDGVLDPGEGLSDGDSLSPPAGITVTAWDATGASVACAVTPGTPPTYSCPVTGLAGSDFRVEFDLDPADAAAGFAPGPHGADNGTSVQFVSAGDAGVDFATVPPSQCPTTGGGFGGNANSADGKLWTTCFVNGDRDAGDPNDVLVGLNYDRTGAIEKIGLAGDGDNATAISEELGSVWGIAYDEWNSVLFTSAFLKRHSQFGAEGLDGLYWMTYPSGTWNSISLDSLGGPQFGAPIVRDLEGIAIDGLSYDSAAHSLVGSTGIGDIDITPDGRTLLVTNLEAKTLEVFDVAGLPAGGSPVWQESIPIGNPGCPDASNTDDYEIFAVKNVDGSTAYVGVTCTARTSQDRADLMAFVVPVTLGGAAGAPVFTVPFDYPHPCGAASLCTAAEAEWDPWRAVGDFNGRDRNYSQPILSDIELTSDGSMVLGIADRNGHLQGPNNYGTDPTSTRLYNVFSAGDVLHACNVSGDPDNPSWVLEGGAGSACDATPNGYVDATGLDPTNRDAHLGPGGGVEWYGAEVRANHPETSLGGLYVHQYLDEVVLSAMDPVGLTSGGLSWFGTTDGSLVDGYELYAGKTDVGLLGKAAGIGDVEGCFIPIEIGNFVWLDLDGDGIQDPGETPLAGVTVTLYDASGNVVATTTTDANGEYYFDSADGVQANSAYTITFDVLTNTTPLPGGYTNADLVETMVDNAATGDDSDSDVVNGDIAVMTGDPGTNDHTFDAGFMIPIPEFDLALQKQLADGTNLGLVSVGDTVTFTITVINQGDFDATDIVVTDYLPATGLTLADPAWTDNGDGTADISIAGPLAAGASTTVDISFTVDAGASGQIDNWAEISSADDDGDPSTPAPIDVDSTPDTDPADDNQPAGPDALTDDEIAEDGLNGGDEDDHDVAGIVVLPTFDLALQKQLADGTNLADVSPGDSVTFTITVTNQGQADGSDITVTDYLPAFGLTLADPAWTDNGDGTAQIAIPGPLAPGASTTVDITFTVDAGASGPINNWAEISDATPTNADGDTIVDAAGVPIADIDSVPDTDPADDNQPSGPNDTTDDEIAEDGLNGGDEDDHDVAGIIVDGATFDLALQKQLADGTNLADVSPGDSVTFTITVTNQGTVDGSDITVTDYLPAFGLTLADPAWTDNGDDTAQIAIPGPLAPGASTTVDITFTVDAGASGPINNWAEISDATPTDSNGDPIIGSDGNPIPDVDSTPDADPADDNQPAGPDALTDDEIGEDGLNGGDEDDHDVAGIIVDGATFDLALQKQLADGTNLSVVLPGDSVTFTITVTNQGTVDGSNMTVTDYLPASGLTLADSAWTDNGDGTADIAIPGPLAPGASTTVDITFTVDADASGQINNWAEISEATPTDSNGDPIIGSDGNPIPDVDSTPDADPADDNQPAGPNDTTDDTIGEDGLNGGDEDDHDVAGVTVGIFDLALVKTMADGSNLGSASPGDSVTFNIEVFNQGTVDATDIVVTDYLPAGLTLADAGWTDNGDGTATLATPIPGPLAPGASEVVTITFTIDATANGTIVNWAEISGSDNDGDPLTPAPSDVDSTPDTDPADDNQPAGPNALTDDEIGEDGLNGGDEDDHDVAGITIIPPVFDLALQKQLADGTNLGGVLPGDSVTFTITVTNQGEVNAENMTVTDYLPASGLTLADSAWTDNGDGTADIAILGPLAPGASTTVDITFTVDADATGQINNWAEISAADPTDGNGTVLTDGSGIPLTDVDSTPDADPADDNQPSGPNDTTDDTIDEDGLNGGDEDDHDVAGVTVGIFDLALVKTMADGSNLGSASPGDSVTFNIEVFNQGTVDATDIVVTDYLPAGLTLADAGWTDNGDGTATLATPIPGPLAPGASEVVTITFTIDATANGTIVNWAEISGSDNDGDPLTPAPSDVDSTPDTDPADDNQPAGPNALTDDEIGEDGLNGGDEDDHDVAGITIIPPVFDLALQKQLADGTNLGGVLPGDSVTFTITVTNQGEVNAENMTVTDYLPASGLTLADSAWTDNGDGTAQIAILGPLAPGASTTVDITFTVDADASGQINNWAEISAADPTDGNGTVLTDGSGIPLTDVDSTPDADPADDNQPSGPNDTTDDTIGEDGLNGGDEDDHDVAGVTIGEDTYSLGNQVWFDTNNDGVIDPGEEPIEGVWVELFADADGDGLPDDLNGDGIIDVDDAVATTGTDADGNYLFDGLMPGDYLVGIPPMEWDVDGPLYGYLSSDPTSTNPNDDIDNEDNGFPGQGGYVWSGPVTIGDGEPTGEANDNDANTPDANENLTVDFGFYQPVFDMALFKRLADGSDLATVSQGDEVTFTLSIVNQGSVAAANLTIVDFVPSGLTLADADWTGQSDGTATIQVAGPIAPGATATVDITFTVNANATGGIDNWAEIGSATPVDVLGVTITMPNGVVLPDSDSTDGNGFTGRGEDDDDVARLNVAANLAFTGSESIEMIRLSLLMLLAGGFAIVLAKRRKEEVVVD